MTLKDLANALSDYGIEVSEKTVSAWESGRNQISAEKLFYVTRALGCTVQSIYAVDIVDPDARLLQELCALSDKERAILMYAATQWQGDTHALIEFVALYMSLNKKTRFDIAGMGVHQFSKAHAAGELVPGVPEVDIDMIEQKWLRLLKDKE
jgi:transcriptional regulator with XRE-family HTH domain